MPRYFVKTFAGREQEIALEMLLRPQSYHDGGALEDVREQSQSNADAIGRLLAHFVEEGKMPLDKAKQIAGIYDEVYAVETPGAD